MQRISWLWFVVVSMAVALHGIGDRDAQAQSGSVKAIFEKHNLLGVFAWDCSKPASKGNLYYVTRLLDADRVQRDEMDDPTNRTWFMVLDKATEIGRNEVRLSGELTGIVRGEPLRGQPVDGIWRIEQNRLMQWEATLSGKKTIAEGRFIATGKQMPWLYRCGAGPQ